jgi:hypothetical protein
MRQPVAVPATQVLAVPPTQVLAVPPRLPSAVLNPVAGKVELSLTSAVLMVRVEATADDSLAAMRARNKVWNRNGRNDQDDGHEKPFCLRISISPFSVD